MGEANERPSFAINQTSSIWVVANISYRHPLGIVIDSPIVKISRYARQKGEIISTAGQIAYLLPPIVTHHN